MKLLVTGIDHPQEVGSWSGIPYHLSLSLVNCFTTCFFGGLPDRKYSRHKLFEILYPRLNRGDYRIRSEPSVLREFARELQRAIDREKPDAVVSIGCEPIAYLNSNLPMYLIHDSTFRLLVECYPHFQALSKRSRKTGEEAQKHGFDRATLTLPASEWARRSACEDYGLPRERTHVLAMGANLIDPPSREEVLAAIEVRLASPEVQFLFVGVEWGRKGGPTALAIVEALIARGMQVKLHLVGCTPPPDVLKKTYIVSHGFLSKKQPDQAAALVALFRDASFFIVPSVAECYGCVFCEANAFGVPSISRATGGIPDIVKSGETGFLLSDELSEEGIAQCVSDLIQNPSSYREMAVRARSDYEDRLNWDVYSRQLRNLTQGKLTSAGRCTA